MGSLRGGLGKLPGFYFQILNSDSSAHMQKQLMKAIKKAMSCDRSMLDKMSIVARRSCFPVEDRGRCPVSDAHPQHPPHQRPLSSAIVSHRGLASTP